MDAIKFSDIHLTAYFTGYGSIKNIISSKHYGTALQCHNSWQILYSASYSNNISACSHDGELSNETQRLLSDVGRGETP